MTTALDALETQVLQLSLIERSQLLDRLIASLGADPDIQAAWAREAERREADILQGKTQPLDGAQVVAELRARLS